MTAIWSEQGYDDYVRAARATKSMLADFLADSVREGATSKDIVDLYASSVMVYACANYRARAVASVPLKVVDGDGGEVPLSEPLARLFKIGFRETMRRTELSIFFWGRNLLLKRLNAFGFVVGLRWINPLLWRPEVSSTDGLVGFRFSEPINQIARAGALLPPQQFVYQHGVDFADDFDGVAPAEVAFLEAGLEVEMATTIVSYFRNRAIPAAIVQPAKETQTVAGQALSPEHENALSLANFLRIAAKGSKNAGRTIVQPVRWEAVVLQQSFKDLAMSEMYHENRQQIAIASDVPLELIIPTASNYAQIYDVRRGWYEGWVRPQVEWYCESFTEQLASLANPAWRVVPDFEGVAAMKEDAAARQNRIVARVQAGLLDLGRAQRELGDEQDEALDGLYLVNGIPVPRDHLRDLWTLRFGISPASERTALLADEQSPKLPPRPPSDADDIGGTATPPTAVHGVVSSESTALGGPFPPAEKALEPAGASVAGEASKPTDEAVTADAPPQNVVSEIKSWAYVSARKGTDYPFEVRHLPPDTAAYVELLIATKCGDLLAPEEIIAAAKADYIGHHLSGQKHYSETALDYRAALLRLVRSVFDEEVLKRQGVPQISKQEFVDLGHARILASFRKAFVDGLQEAGVNTSQLDDDEESELALRVNAEQTYFAALANELYDSALPTYLEALAFQEDSRMPDITLEERAELQQKSLEKYRDFVKARERMEQRVDGYVFKGLEQIHTLGRIYGKKNGMQKWVRNPQKDSCRSCLALDGQVHRAKDFLRYVIPQSSKLLCHGDKCGCQLVNTNERARGRLDRVPLNRSAKSDAAGIGDFLGAIAMKSSVFSDMGFCVSLAGESALVEIRHQIAQAAGASGSIDISGIVWTESFDFQLPLARTAEPQPADSAPSLVDLLSAHFASILSVGVPITGLEVQQEVGGDKCALVAMLESEDNFLNALNKAAVRALSEKGVRVDDFSLPENYRPRVALAELSCEQAQMLAPLLADLEVGGRVVIDNVCLMVGDHVVAATSLRHAGEVEDAVQQNH